MNESILRDLINKRPDSETIYQTSRVSQNDYECTFKSTKEEDGIVAIHENNNSSVTIIKSTINIELNPGERIIIKKEGTDNKIATSIKDRLFTPNTGTSAANSDIIYNKAKEWMELANQQVIDLQEKYGDLSEKNKTLQIENVELINNNERKAIIMKYGLTSYLIFLVFSLALFFVSGTLFVLWRINDIFTFNPGSLLYGSLMGLGWAATAVAGVFSIRNRVKAQ